MKSRIREFTKSCRTPDRKPDLESHAVLARVRQFKSGNIKQKQRQKFLVPGCCSKCCDPSLEYPHEELEGIFFYYHKIYQRKEDAAMDDETHYHSDHIHPQLPRNHLQVSNGDDLSTDEAGNTKRGIPEGKRRICL